MGTLQQMKRIHQHLRDAVRKTWSDADVTDPNDLGFGPAEATNDDMNWSASCSIVRRNKSVPAHLRCDESDDSSSTLYADIDGTPVELHVATVESEELANFTSKVIDVLRSKFAHSV
ncbi:hypothetical protein WMF27_30180 [Sorangium sp. So ce281]|uniref:hypothetical protein n=1 Tax=unclassified Sorangium TaxID=2621164 RepID=UPI003F638A26